MEAFDCLDSFHGCSLGVDPNPGFRDQSLSGDVVSNKLLHLDFL